MSTAHPIRWITKNADLSFHGHGVIWDEGMCSNERFPSFFLEVEILKNNKGERIMFLNHVHESRITCYPPKFP